MKTEEYQRIKDEYKNYKAMLQEQKELRETLETKVDTYANLRILADKLEMLDDELFYIQNETEFYRSLADRSDFERLQCGTDKKMYFFYGYCIKDKEERDENRWGDDYVIFLPRDTKFSPFKKYYVLLWDLVDSRGHILVPLKEYEQFKKKNYVFDIGEEVNIPYSNDKEYNEVRRDWTGAEDNYEAAYNKLRTDLFRSYVHSENESEAVQKLALKHKL
jgi:hypothetical protein